MSTARLEVLQRPPQGWSSLLLCLGMLALVGVSIADSRPLALAEGGVHHTGSLVFVMLAAGLVGFVLARSSLGIVRSHVLGALTGALVLLSLVGAAVQSSGSVLLLDLDEFGSRMVALNAALETNIAVWLDGPGSTPVVATLLVLGGIGWTTGQFSAFSIFRYDRGGPAVAATGVLLFLNIATESIRSEADLLPLIPVLAIYSALAMLLLIRLRLLQQSEQWARRHISDARDVGRLFLRSGSIFVLLAVVGASSLAVTAVTRPPDVDVDDLSAPFADLAESLSRWLAFFAVPVEQGQSSEFGDRFEVAQSWEKGDGIAFTVAVSSSGVAGDANDVRGNYFWGSAYDHFDGFEWTRGDPAESTVPQGQPLQVDMAADSVERILVSTRIMPQESGLARGTLLGLAEAQEADRDVIVATVSRGQGLADITFVDEVASGDAYVVSSLVHDYEGGGASLTANALRQAGTDYPGWVTRRYLQTLEEGSAPRTVALARRIERAATRTEATDNAYDKALDLQGRLNAMDYTTDLVGVCGGLSTPECLLEYGRGFCQQYATTMVMVLREMGIPARLVQGYLPGLPDGNGDHEVPNQALHAWVESYFPGFGWIRFDPTPPGGVERFGQEVTAFDDGPSIDRLPPEPTPGPDENNAETPEPTSEPFSEVVVVPPDEPTSGDGALGQIVVLTGVLVLVVLGLLSLAVYRLRRLSSLDGATAYHGIASLATRLGHGPLPTQTAYEYAGSLAESLPSVRDDLYLVADVQVRSAYGQDAVSQDHLAAMKQAYARIRTALLRLVLRRGD